LCSEKGILRECSEKEYQQITGRFQYICSQCRFQNYFDCFAEESTFIGTDATEVWDKKQFMDYAKPFFDKGKVGISNP
jgi:hypothetical protein